MQAEVRFRVNLELIIRSKDFFNDDDENIVKQDIADLESAVNADFFDVDNISSILDSLAMHLDDIISPPHRVRMLRQLTKQTYLMARRALEEEEVNDEVEGMDMQLRL